MIHLASPYEGFKVFIPGIMVGFFVARYYYRRPKTYEFTNLRFGDMGEKKGIKL